MFSLLLFKQLCLTTMNLENNDVYSIVTSVLKTSQVFPVSFFSAELWTRLKTIDTPFCGEGKKHMPKKRTYVSNSGLDSLL